MKHRGRHRRRRRGTALRAALAGAALALTATATIVSASQATVAEDPGALKPLTSAADTGRLQLQENLVPRRSLDRLASAMGGTIGVADILEDADHNLRTAADCDSADRDSLPPLYLSCGTEDFLYPSNQRFLALAEELDVRVQTELRPGAHEWGFWDESIQRVLGWLPLRR